MKTIVHFENFEKVAELLYRINPAVASQGYDAKKLAAHMQATAYRLADEDVTFGGTFGYCVTLYPRSTRDGYNATATLMPYTVEWFLERLDHAKEQLP